MSFDTPGGPLIRAVERRDLPPVAALALQAFGEMWSPATLSEKIADECSTFLLAQTGQDIPGFILAFTVLDEMDLQLLAVAPSARRQGVGIRLVKALLAQAHDLGVRRIHLEVRESNLAAKALYAAAGFHQSGLRKAYYTKPAESALVLTYSL